MDLWDKLPYLPRAAESLSGLWEATQAAVFSLAVAGSTVLGNFAPKTPEYSPVPPTIVKLDVLDQDKGMVSYSRVVMQDIVEVTPTADGKKNRLDYRSIPANATAIFPLKDVHVFDASNKRIPAEAFWGRAKAGDIILISEDGKRVDPSFLSIVNERTLIVVLPPPPPLPPEFKDIEPAQPPAPLPAAPAVGSPSQPPLRPTKTQHAPTVPG